jgi:hypothetical protein
LILCKLEPKTRYVLGINQQKGWQHFSGLSGQEPDAGQLIFETSDAPAVMSVAALVNRDPQLATLIRR